MPTLDIILLKNKHRVAGNFERDAVARRDEPQAAPRLGTLPEDGDVGRVV